MKQWELNEIMNRVKDVGDVVWKLERTPRGVDVVGQYTGGRPSYWVAQDMAYDDANFIAHALQDTPQLVARIRELEQALKFYADAKNHDETVRSSFNSEYYQSKAMIDGGKLAREALRNDD